MIGSSKSLGVLERMLADEKDSHMACYAIGRQPSVAAGEILARGLALAKGRTAVNILNVLGSRGEEKGWEAVAKRYDDPDDAVSAAALSALAKIGTKDTYQRINQARNLFQGERRRTAVWAMLECAEKMAGHGDTASALKIYEGLTKENEAAVRRGALAGRIAVGAQNEFNAAVAAIRGNDPMLAQTAIAAIMRRQDTWMMSRLSGEQDGFSPEMIVVIFDAFGTRAKTENEKEIAIGFAVQSEQFEETAINSAAARMMGRLGDSSASTRLLRWLITANERGREKVAQAARDALAQLPSDAGTDQQIAAVMTDAKSATLQHTLIKLLVARRATGVTPVILQQAQHSNPVVVQAAIEAVGILGANDALPSVLDLMRTTKDEYIRVATEQAATAIASRNPDLAKRANLIISAFREEKAPAARASLVRVLGSVGGAAALEVLRGALGDSETAVRDAALRSLAGWQEVSAVPALLEVAKQGDEKDVRRAIALRGALRQLGDAAAKSKGPAGVEVVDGFASAAALVKSADEKRLLLSGVSQLRDAKAVGIVEKYLGDAEVSAEAKLAAAKVAENVEAIDPAAAKRLRGK